MPIPPADLENAALRVVDCINQILASYFFQTSLLPHFRDSEIITPELEPAMTALENSSLDSSMLAIRKFNDFVRNCGSKPDDLKAKDFQGLNLPNKIGMGASNKMRVNKLIGHLTTEDLTQRNHGFFYRPVLADLLPDAIEFCDYVAHQFQGRTEYAKGTKASCERVATEYVKQIPF